MSGCFKPSHHIKISSESRKDFKAWRIFLKKFNSTPILPTIDWSSDYTWQLYSDASGKAFGLVFGDRGLRVFFHQNGQIFQLPLKSWYPFTLRSSCGVHSSKTLKFFSMLTILLSSVCSSLRLPGILWLWTCCVIWLSFLCLTIFVSQEFTSKVNTMSYRISFLVCSSKRRKL